MAKVNHIEQYLTCITSNLSNTEVFVKPPLNGDYIKYVILGRKFGVCIVDVINTDVIENIITFVQKKISELDYHKKNIRELYLARTNKKVNSEQIFKYMLIFPNIKNKLLNTLISKSSILDELHSPLYCAGRETIKKKETPTRFYKEPKKDIHLESDEYDDLYNWCVEYEYLKEQYEEVPLTDIQEHIISRDRLKEKIIGPAGSGKSVVLIGKAAKAVKNNQKVLLIVYNKTLRGYLSSLCTRKPFSFNPHKIKILHFHGWINEVGKNFGIDIFARNENDDKEKFLNVVAPNKIKKLLSEKNTKKYDVVLVDELNDMYPDWIDILNGVLKDKGKLIVAGDNTQNIYKRNSENMMRKLDVLGFKEQSSSQELRDSHRLPEDMINILQKFLSYFPMKDSSLPVVPKQMNLQLDESAYKGTFGKWINIEDIIDANQPKKDSNEKIDIDKVDSEKCVEEIINILKCNKTNSVSDLTFISSHRNIIKSVSEALKLKDYKVIDTLKDEDKINFFKEDKAIKCTTIKSFKGWEGRLIIIYLKGKIDQDNLKLLYTALSRVKKNDNGAYITVITKFKPSKGDDERKLKSYIQEFNDYLKYST
jgi:thymidine kinase